MSTTPGEPTEEALDLVRALTQAGSPDAAECVRGLEALPKCAPAKQSPLVREAVRSAMKRPEKEVRIAVFRALGELTYFAPDYRTSFALGYYDSDKDVRMAALEGLGRVYARGLSFSFTEVRDLGRLLRDKEPEVRTRVYGRLMNIGRENHSYNSPWAADLTFTTSALVDRLEVEVASDDPNLDPGLRPSGLLWNAVYTTGLLGRYSQRSVPALLKVYSRFPGQNKRDAGMRATVVEALAAIGPHGDKSLPFLVGLIRDKKLPFDERLDAAWAVGRFGPGAVEYLPEMVVLLRQELKQPERFAGTGARVMGGFARLGELAEPVVPLLIELAQGPASDPATGTAIHTLGELPTVAGKRAAPVLAKMYFSIGGAGAPADERALEHALQKALLSFGEETTPHTLAPLKNGPPLQQYKAIIMLRSLGPDSTAALPELKRIAQDDKERYQSHAIEALKAIEVFKSINRIP